MSLLNKINIINNIIEKRKPKDKIEESSLIIEEFEWLLKPGRNSVGGYYNPYEECFNVLLCKNSIVVDIIASTKYTGWLDDIHYKRQGLTYIKFNYVEMEWIIKNIKKYIIYYTFLNENTSLYKNIIDKIIEYTWLEYDHKFMQKMQYDLTDY